MTPIGDMSAALIRVHGRVRYYGVNPIHQNPERSREGRHHGSPTLMITPRAVNQNERISDVSSDFPIETDPIDFVGRHTRLKLLLFCAGLLQQRQLRGDLEVDQRENLVFDLGPLGGFCR